MTQSKAVALCIVGAAVGVIFLAATGKIAGRSVDVILAISGVMLFLFRRSVATWASRIGEEGGVVARWQDTRPWTVGLVGATVALLGVYALLQNGTSLR